ncbi:MAG: glycosyl hydrolase, partial [bacterium]|nr:glycosyl hydrolase [bacterium]
LFKQLEWKNIGPYVMGGRIDDIEGYHSNPFKFYVATASGGLWLTENNGTTWKPVFDSESSITIGDIAVSQTEKNLVWVGSGEQNSSRSSYAGTGVFKSIDSGKTWRNMGLTDSHHIGKVLIDPTDNNIVFVAALGHLYSDNDQRGLYKTVDGGKTWKRVLYISPKTGVIDVVMHPKNPAVLYAASWQRDRKAWNFIECGPESTIYKSTDHGETWKKIVNGFPQTEFIGRIGLAVTHAAPDVLYAFLDNQELKPEEKKKHKDKPIDANKKLYTTNIIGAEVYRSNDAGETWTKANQSYLKRAVNTYGYYFGQIRIAPDNADVVYILAVPLLKSIDGGKTFKNISRQGGIMGDNGVHGDMQALWIDPKDSRRLVLGNDGGLNISYDTGATWQKINNISIAQCYTIHYDNQKPYNIYTGLQDNGVNIGPSDFRFGNNPWKRLLGGDGAFVQPEPGNPDIVYAEFQFGYIFRLDLKNRKMEGIRPQSPDKKSPYRFNWLSPFMVSRHNPYTLYMGGNKMLKSVNRGDKWLEISPDLTLAKNTEGDVPFATIVAIDESPLQPELLYAGTDDGNVWVKKENTSSWEKINNRLPKKWVTRLIASKYKKERVYITLTGYREDDFKTYVYTSEDYGKTWTSIKANLPEEPLNVIREDPVNENILYLGSDLGIYVTLDRAKTWYSLKNNLPTNAVYDLKIQPRENELIIGTHGRGVYLLSVTPIQKITADVLKKSLHLFAIEPVKLATGRYQRQKKAVIQFYSGNETRFQVVITDKKGKKTKQLDVAAVKGFNRFQWDLTLDEAGKKKK